MKKAKILIVDDEEDVCRLIQDRLISLDYDSHYVLNGPDALKFVHEQHPDLIILDILMPGMDGYEVSRELINREGVSTIPIIMLTAQHSRADKLKALTMGIDDYITKPFDFDELAARIEAVLRRSKREKIAPRISSSSGFTQNLSLEDSKRLELLRNMLRDKVQKLEPIYHLSSETAYAYPFAAKIFDTKDGSEVLQLEVLANRQCLQREFFDRILECPFCKNYNLNIRESCVTCHSPHLKVVDMIHHFRCAYTGMEDEFKQGIDYVCPKCHRELKSIGVDYDKPGQDYYCEACHHLATEAATGAQCRCCFQIFVVENALRQNIYSYELTQQASLAVEQGAFADSNPEDSWIDEETDVYNLRYLRSVLAQEFKQAQHFKRSLSLIFLSLENYKSVLRERGEVVAKKLIKNVTNIFKESLREVDVPARFQENSLVAMLVECDKKKAIEILKEIRSKIDQSLSASFGTLLLTLKAVSFPEDGKNEEALLKELLESKPI